MTKLVWDQVGDRRYETGVDRGVLYLPDGDGAVPWNGLMQVTENREREVKSYYIDGIKYLDHHVPDTYSAKLQAFTYPEELEDLTGTAKFAPGVFLHDQRARQFSLSYRTLVGNDLEGTDHGYKIHVIYHVMAVASSAAIGSIGNAVTPSAFEWALTAVPDRIFGARPTSHISIHSLGIDPDLLEVIESRLYGTDDEPPSLPSLVDLLNLVEEAQGAAS
jgi:hypothetical protein